MAVAETTNHLSARAASATMTTVVRRQARGSTRDRERPQRANIKSRCPRIAAPAWDRRGARGLPGEG
jgi:hypothetical protein